MSHLVDGASGNTLKCSLNVGLEFTDLNYNNQRDLVFQRIDSAYGFLKF